MISAVSALLPLPSPDPVTSSLHFLLFAVADPLLYVLVLLNVWQVLFFIYMYNNNNNIFFPTRNCSDLNTQKLAIRGNGRYKTM